MTTLWPQHTFRKSSRSLQGKRGVEHWKSRLDEDKVRQIRAWHEGMEMTQTEMGNRLGVCRQAIHYVVSGKTWGWVK